MKLLVVVQGITKNDDYILKSFIEYLDLHPDDFALKCDKFGNTWIQTTKSNYLILIVNTERYLSQWSLLGPWDRFGDFIVGVVFNKAYLARIAIDNAIEDIKKQYPQINEIHGLGHSFGAYIISFGMQTFFKSLTLCGCPLSASGLFKPISKILLNKIQGLKTCTKLINYLWNKDDPFCNNPLDVQRILYFWPLRNLNSGKGHTFYNRKKKLEDCYLPHVDKVLQITKRPICGG